MNLLKNHLAEAIAGLAVIVLAAFFLTFALGRTGSAGAGTYELSARFPNVAGISIGSDVRLSGVKIGRVITQRLDPASYQAILTFTVAKDVKLPADSSAAITSEGLLGGNFIALVPGGDSTMLKPGAEITDTQGATDLMGLIGSVINRSGDAPAHPAGAAAG